MAKNYVDNLSEEVKKGMREKARQGIYPSHAPLGYINVADGSRKKIVPDPARADLVADLFKVYAEGRLSLKQLAALSKEWGLKTKKGNPVNRSGIADMLNNPAYCGRILWDGEEYTGTHTPLVDRITFERVQRVMKGRTSRLGYGHVPIAYRGLIRCKCGGILTGEIKKGQYIYYHCSRKRNGCDLPYVKEERFTDDFARLFEDLSIPNDVLLWLKQALRDSFGDENASMRNRL